MHKMIPVNREPSVRNSHYIVAGLSDADMIWLLSMGKLRRLKAGETLAVAGRPLNELLFITRGSFAVILGDAQIATLKDGDVVGEMSFVERHPPTVTVRAIEGGEALGIPREAIEARFAAEPVFAARFYRALALFLSEKLRDTTAAMRSAQDHQEVHSAMEAASERFGSLFRKLRG